MGETHPSPHRGPQQLSRSSADTSTLTCPLVWIHSRSDMASTAPNACGDKDHWHRSQNAPVWMADPLGPGPWCHMRPLGSYLALKGLDAVRAPLMCGLQSRPTQRGGEAVWMEGQLNPAEARCSSAAEQPLAWVWASAWGWGFFGCVQQWLHKPVTTFPATDLYAYTLQL